MINKLKVSKNIIILGIFIAFLPYLPVLFYSLPISIIGNCNINVGSVNSCIVIGHDFGESVTVVSMIGWLTFFFTFPLGGLVVLIGLIKLVIEKSKSDNEKN